MTEIDALKYELEQQEKAYNKLHKMYVSLLKQQGELEKENKQLKKELNAFKPIIFEDTNNGSSSILYEKVEE